MMMESGRNRVLEFATGAGLAAAAFALGFGIVRLGRADRDWAPEPARQPTGRLSAISATSARASVLRLLNSGAAAVEIWRALQDCDRDELSQLFATASAPPVTNLGQMGRMLVLARWVEVAPADAAEAAAAQWDAMTCLHSAIGLWAESDPHAALDYANSRDFGVATMLVYNALSASASRAGDVDIDSLVARFPQDQRAMSEWPYKQSSSDPVSNLRSLMTSAELRKSHSNPLTPIVVNSLAENALQEHPANAVIAVYAEDTKGILGDPDPALLALYYEEDPAAASDWVFDREDRFAAARLGVALANKLAEEEPERAAEVVAQLPASHAREEALGNVAYNWRARDRDAFGSWREGLDAGDRFRLDQILHTRDEIERGEGAE